MPSESTITQYSRVVATLSKRGVDDFEDTDVILELIKKTAKGEDASDNSIKNNLNALMWKVGKESPAYEVYRKHMYDMRDILASSKTYTTTEKSVSWNVLSQIYKNYDGQDRRILAVYSLCPPRRLLDYSSMQVVARKPAHITGNYLVLNKSSCKFYFGDYKTFKTYGVQSFVVPPALKRELVGWAVVGQPLFKLASGLQFADTQFSTRIGDLTAPYTPNHVRATPNTFRHSYISHFLAGNPNLKDREVISNMMAHDVITQMSYEEREKE